MDRMSQYRLNVLAVSVIIVAGACGSSPSSPDRRGGAVGEGASPLAVEDGVVGRTESEKAAFDSFVRHESQFKEHYRAHYAASGYDYNQYRPAYQHGFELALDKRYVKMDWSQLESQARRTWDESKMGLWDQYKDAVRYGWEQGAMLERLPAP